MYAIEVTTTSQQETKTTGNYIESCLSSTCLRAAWSLAVEACNSETVQTRSSLKIKRSFIIQALRK